MYVENITIVGLFENNIFKKNIETWEEFNQLKND